MRPAPPPPQPAATAAPWTPAPPCRAAADEAAKTLEEVDEAVARAEDANEQLELDNHVLEKVIAVRGVFLAAVQYLQQVR